MKSFASVGKEVLDRNSVYREIKKGVSPSVVIVIQPLYLEDLFGSIRRGIKERAMYGDTGFVT